MSTSIPASRREMFYAYDYGKNILKTMPLDSSLYDPDDTTAFVISYLQTVEKARRDVAQLMTLKTFWGYEQMKKRHKQIMPQEEFKSAQEFIPALLSYHRQIRRPLFSDHPSKFPAQITHFPVGLLTQSGDILSGESLERRQMVFNFYVERQVRRSSAKEPHSDFFTEHLLSRMSAALNNIGIQMQNWKNFAAADYYLRRALARQSDLAEAWNNLGINFYLRGDYASAEKIFEEGVRKASRTELLYYHLGLSQRKAGKKNEAKESLRQSLKLNPGNPGALNELGLIFLEEKNWEEAKLLFEKCAKLRENYAPAHYNLGLVYKSLGLRFESAESFEKYLRYAPEALDANEVRKWILNLRKS